MSERVAATSDKAGKSRLWVGDATRSSTADVFVRPRCAVARLVPRGRLLGAVRGGLGPGRDGVSQGANG
eukprot:6189444-Pleurochrysis_carterae.AAC.3